jgi:O-antigen ligase
MPVVATLLGVGVSFALGRKAASIQSGIAPATVLVAGVVVALVGGSAVVSSEPLSGPFGYATARAAFFVQVGLAGLMLASALPTRFIWILGASATVASIAVVVASGSTASVALLAVLGGLALLGSAGGWHGAALGAAAGLFVVVLGMTMALGALYAPGDPRTGRVDRIVDSTLTERRLVLWNDALSIVSKRPLAGVGPGRFQLASPTARADADARWAHHGFLQQAAETGVIGFVLLVALFLWGFFKLWAGPPDAIAVLGAAALAALGIHACVDYVLHFPAVPMAAGLLVGAATASRRSDRE